LDPIHQEILLAAAPSRVYRALTDSVEFARFSGAPAAISPLIGGVFSCFGSMVFGRNLEFLPDRRIVQAWRIADWPDGVYSIVRFELEPDQGGTRLTLDQAGVPDAARHHVDPGWHLKYWEPLRKYLAA
jgi:activator of HSP90 ATPase